ncbi:hypothetical protein AXF42_Ash000739 [Apostasia shenzhenica]|uniref:Uncharacterized protein n=1 Tax=Apostasia shenzhenica TaxID=1088818 RepID=A0A2I0AH78_9ASPA|nr:hypothetical protein AXF42_Ash000739 [Apostasia shenzhenica]
MSDAGAAPGVGIRLGASSAVVVGGAAAGAGNGAALEGAVADVPRGRQDSAARLRRQIKLLPAETLSNRPLAGRMTRDPPHKSHSDAGRRQRRKQTCHQNRQQKKNSRHPPLHRQPLLLLAL